MSSKTKNKSQKDFLLRKKRFSKKQKILNVIMFVVVFGAIGSYVLFRIFAASATPHYTGLAPVWTADNNSYRTVEANGTVANYGFAKNYGTAYGKFSASLARYAVGISTGHSKDDYFVALNDGTVYAFNSRTYGDLPSLHVKPAKPVVAIVATNSGNGYWLVSADGGIYAFGDAHYYNSLPGLHISVSNIVAMAPTTNDGGYWLLGADGGVFSFGNAHYYGNGKGLSKTAFVSIAIARGGTGYYLLAKDGGLFSRGSAHFYGSNYGEAETFVDLTPDYDGLGYWVLSLSNFEVHGSAIKKQDNIAQPLANTSHISDSYWDLTSSSGYSSLQANILPITATINSTEDYYYSLYANFVDHPDIYHLYAGIQTNGDNCSRRIGRMAIFSVWGATGGKAATGGTGCWFNEGTGGYSVRLPYVWTVGHNYTVKMYVTSSTSPISGSRTWGATVTDINTGKTTYIGSLYVPASVGYINYPITFQERDEGDTSSCASPTPNEVAFTNVSANNNTVVAHTWQHHYQPNSVCGAHYMWERDYSNGFRSGINI